MQVTSIARQLPARIRERNLTLVAAGVAFYAFLALIPALIAGVSIYGLVADPADVKRLIEDIGSSLPAEVKDFLVFQLTSIVDADESGVTTATVIALALALWSAAGGMQALITAIHVAYGTEQPKSFAARRGKALLLTLAAIVFLGVVTFLIVAAHPLLDRLDVGTAGHIALELIRWLGLALVVLTGVGLLYRTAVHDGRILTPGTVSATVLWLVASGLFAAYTENFASYGKTYGALASIVVVLLWLWLGAFALLIGAEIDGMRQTRT